MITESIDKDTLEYYQCKAVLSGNILEIYKYQRKQVTHNKSNRQDSIRDKKTNENPIATDRKQEYINQSKRDLRRQIEANLNQGKQYDKFLTLTFAKNITDKEYCLMKYRSFIKSLQRSYGDIKYITVLEKQKRGAYHFHIILFDFPYIDLEVLNNKWKYGYTDIKIIKNNSFIKNGRRYEFSGYLVKYLGKDFGGSNEKKQRRYYKSRNLKKPITVYENDVINILATFNYYEIFECDFNNQYVGDVIYKKIVLQNNTIKQ